jgi:hypothetical protein
VKVVRASLFQHWENQTIFDPLPILFVELTGTQRILEGLF